MHIEELPGAILHLMIGLDLLGIHAISLLRSGWRVERFRMVRLHLRVLVHERGVADVACHSVVHQAGRHGLIAQLKLARILVLLNTLQVHLHVQVFVRG